MTPSSRGVFFSRKGRVRSLSLALGLLTMAFAATNARAQGSCDGTWVPTMGPSGVDGSIYAMATWDPDGPGPLPACAVMGGTFEVAGDTIATNIALWNPSTSQFTPLGAGVNGRVRALAALPDGRLAVAGDFSMAGNTPANRVAIWDGRNWSALGAGIDVNPTSLVEVDSLAGLADGSVIVAGNIFSAGGVMTGSVARWDGQTWSSLGPTAFADSSRSLSIDPISHDLFAAIGGSAMRWNGTSWAAVPGGAYRYNFSFDDEGSLYSASSGGILARWDRSSWSNVAFSYGYFECVLGTDPGLCSRAAAGYQVAGQRGLPRLTISFSGGNGFYGMSSDVYSLLRSTNGSMLAGGTFESYGVLQSVFDSQYPRYVPSVLLGQPAKFENGVLGPLRSTGALIQAGKLIELDDGTIATIDRGRLGVYTYDASGSWTNQPFDRSFFCGLCGRFLYVEDIAPIPGGGMVAIQDDAVYSSRNGDGFVRIGLSGNLSDRFNRTPQAAGLLNGDVVVASPDLTVINSVPVHGFARWDGQTWSDMCSGFVQSTLSYDNNFHVAVAPNGDLIVASNLVSINGVPVHAIARWDGSSWHAVGDCGLDSVSLMAIRGNGNIVVAGYPAASSQIAICEWNGSAWASIEAPFPLGTPDGSVHALATRPSGDIVVAGRFDTIGNGPAANIARWDGFSWRPVGEGLPTPSDYGAGVYGLVVASDDTIFAGGQFSHSGNTVSYGIAHAIFTGNLPTITQQPAAAATCVGYGAAFHVAASAEGSLTYQWSINGSAIDIVANPSAASDTLVLASNAPFGDYRCTITNGCGSITTDPATLASAPCCPDVNVDGNIDQNDVDYLLNVVSGGDNPNTIDPDFNHDGNTDQDDIDALINVAAGGDCP